MKREKYYPGKPKIPASAGKAEENLDKEDKETEDARVQDMVLRPPHSKQELLDATLHPIDGATAKVAAVLLKYDMDTPLAMLYDLEERVRAGLADLPDKSITLPPQLVRDLYAIMRQIADEVEAEMREKFPSDIPEELERLSSIEGLLNSLEYGMVLDEDKTKKKDSVLRFRRQKVQSVMGRFKHFLSETIDNRLIELDIDAELEASRQWYAEHHLNEFALPATVELSPEARAQIVEASREGYDSVMIMPTTELQQKNIQKIIEETVAKPAEGLSKYDQYSGPAYVKGHIDQQNLELATISNRPPHKAYIILYKKSGNDEETRDKSAAEYRNIFEQKNQKYAKEGKQIQVTGWTGPEYLLVQRRECEKNKNHQWDEHVFFRPEQWSLLLDSPLPSGWLSGTWVNGVVTVEKRGNEFKYGAKSAIIIELGG